MEIYKPEKILRLDFEKDIFAVVSNCIFLGVHNKSGTRMSIMFQSGKILRDWSIRDIYNIPFKVDNFYKLLE